VIDRLRENKVKLRKKIINLRKTHRSLEEHIEYLERLKLVRETLYKPIIEYKEERTVGLIYPKRVRDIVDFFDAGDDIMGDPAWPHFHTHGVLVCSDTISDDAYPFQAMYVDNGKVIKTHPHYFPAGEYLSMYCGHSMENNPHAKILINYAQEIGFEFESQLLIEQVSGPVIEKTKQEFLVKIMLRKRYPV